MQATTRTFVLQIIQPGLDGLMDGSISSLAPLFAAAFATHDSHMAFSEGLSDNGKLSGRGSPCVRGAVCGLMTFLAIDQLY